LSINLLKNDIGTDQVETLVNMLKDHPTLKSLCGNRGDETELDMSGKKLGTNGAIMLAAEIIGNGALSKLDVRKNYINAKGKSALKKAAGVGVFRSRYVQLTFLSFLKALFNNQQPAPSLLRMQDQASTLECATSIAPASPTRSARVSTRMYSVHGVSGWRKRSAGRSATGHLLSG
jgi:hypothetical protein